MWSQPLDPLLFSIFPGDLAVFPPPKKGHGQQANCGWNVWDLPARSLLKMWDAITFWEDLKKKLVVNYESALISLIWGFPKQLCYFFAGFCVVYWLGARNLGEFLHVVIISWHWYRMMDISRLSSVANLQLYYLIFLKCIQIDPFSMQSCWNSLLSTVDGHPIQLTKRLKKPCKDWDKRPSDPRETTWPSNWTIWNNLRSSFLSSNKKDSFFFCEGPEVILLRWDDMVSLDTR